MDAKVYKIFITNKAGAVMQSLEEAVLVAGKGIEGDRYFNGCGTFSEKLKDNPAVELSLIEKEEIDLFNAQHKLNLGYGDFRRNIVTHGIRLNDLPGKEFTVGNVLLRGIRLCEPCAHLAETVNELVLPHLIERGGLRAQIVVGNSVNTGDEIKR